MVHQDDRERNLRTGPHINSQITTETIMTHQQFGNTNLSMPRVVFGATCLGNLFVAMSDEQKRELVREWFAHIPKPVAIDTAGKYGAGLSLEVLGRELAALEGIIPAIETSHAFAVLKKRTFRPEDVLVINLSGRGDKDLQTYIEYFNL